MPRFWRVAFRVKYRILAERESVIRATGQQPFPGNLSYRLGRRHIRAVGVFFRLEDPS
jgi:hypothetical protein